MKRELTKKKKAIYQNFFVKRSEVQKILFIIGCQRSGTTLMADILEKDLNTKIYREFSILSSHDKRKIRLNNLSAVNTEICKNKVPFIVLKPLVETQNTIQLLKFFEGSKALWMVRHYQDVASSDLKHFGSKNGINNLRPIVNKEENNWRSENVSEATRDVVLRFFSEDMSPYDAAALFWYVRNILFFDLKLYDLPSIIMCRYEDLVTSPLIIMREIYAFVDVDFPGDKIVANVHADSINKGKEIKILPDVEKLCLELLERLVLFMKKKQPS